MAKGRFISRSLADSKRLASLADSPGRERAAMLYVFTTLNANVDGRADADALALLGYASRFARAFGWDESTVEEDRVALAKSGLWFVYGDGPFVEIDKFHEHNKVRRDRETPGKIPAPPGVLRESSGSPPGVLRESSSEDEVQPRDYANTSLSISGQGEAEAVRPREYSRGDGGGVEIVRPDHEKRAQKLIDAVRAGVTRYVHRNPDRPLVPPVCDFYEATSLARTLGDTIDLFADGDGDGSLAHEVSRLVAIYVDRGWALSLRGIARQIGQRFPKDEGAEDPVIFQKETDE